MRRSSGETPLLVVASLAAAAADGVDAATLSFLTAQALEDRRKEEEERKMKEKEAQEMKLEELEARQRAGCSELDTLLLVPFERRSDQEEDRVVKLQKLRERLSRERSAILLAPSKREKEEEEEEEAPEVLFFSSLVTMLLALRSFPVVVYRPVMLASWPFWTRSTVTSTLVACLASFACDSAPCAVFPSLSSGPRCSASRRYGPEGILRVVVQKTADFRSRSFSQVADVLFVHFVQVPQVQVVI